MKNAILQLKHCIIILLIVGSQIVTAQSSLKDVFKNYYYIGVALNNNHVTGKDPESVAIVEEHFNSITAENSMKWGPIHPQPGKYNFEQADSFVSFGEKNNMFIIGHCLVWHSQTPKWVFEYEK